MISEGSTFHSIYSIPATDDTVWHFEKNSTFFVKKGGAESLERIDILDPSGGRIGNELAKRDGKGGERVWDERE